MIAIAAWAATGVMVLLVAGLGGMSMATSQDGVAEPAGVVGPRTPAGGVMGAPVRGAAVSQRFGCTSFAAEPVDSACPGGHFHSGVDLAAPLGTPVVAALGGTAHVVRTTTGFGLHVLITSAGGITTLYGHLRGVAVADGDALARGDPVGDMGSTGNSTGPHLHFEVRRDGVPEDPERDVALP